MENPFDPIFEKREELMISPADDGTPNLRAAHFLRPSSTSRNGAVSELPHSSRFGFSDHEIALDVKFKGRRNPPKNWRQWACNLGSRYEPIWRKVGIFDAIMNSTYHMMKDNDLVFGVAQKWCPETNTFIFHWGEATITLEDMVVLGGYPVLGDPCFGPIESSDEMMTVLNHLNEAYREVAKDGYYATTYPWMEHFMGSGHELEHEAFLSLWLSRFVCPCHKYDLIGKKMFPIAARLARGTPVALAPAVLAIIYKDLRLLKQEMVDFVGERGKYGCLVLELWAPFQLVQLWVWERFPTLRPNPNLIILGEPRAARWHRVLKIKVGNVRMALDSAGDSFQWRPYASGVSNWQLPKFYREQEEWVLVSPDLTKELESFARCIRVSELVELGGVEHYLPHRVAMQFGLDQDIPGSVPQDVGWRNYERPISDNTLYIPPRLFESDVTTRYLEWWKHSVSKLQMLPQLEAMANVKKPRSKRRARTGSVKECGSALVQELRSMNKGGNSSVKPFSWSQPESESHSISSRSKGRLRYKSLEEIVQSVASVQVTNDACASSCPNGGVDTSSARSLNGEVRADTAIVKKPKLEAEEKTCEIDKLIARRKAEMVNRFDKQVIQVKMPRSAEIEKIIAELREEFGIKY